MTATRSKAIVVVVAGRVSAGGAVGDVGAYRQSEGV